MKKPKPHKPGPGQESAWDYPRPPSVELAKKSIQISFAGVKIAATHQAWRVLETSHPPVYYLPPADIRTNCLTPAGAGSWCEWKGQAAYYNVEIRDRTAERVAWTYPRPTPSFRVIKDHIAFYAWAMEQCIVDGEIVRPQAGNFYGGWITDDIVGPFKGEPGTWGW
jgi:uncharacterized protein (DUF427 family)